MSARDRVDLPPFCYSSYSLTPYSLGPPFVSCEFESKMALALSKCVRSLAKIRLYCRLVNDLTFNVIGSTMQRISSNVVSLNHDIIYLYSVVRELKLMETRKKNRLLKDKTRAIALYLVLLFLMLL